jgi:hypothetical protein
MRRFIKQLLDDIRRGENIDLLVTIGLVLAISVLNGLGRASAELVSSITLASLGLIAVGFLVTRYRLEDIYRKEDTPNSVQFAMQRTPTFSSDLATAKEIWMAGIILRGTTTGNFHEFKKKAEQKGKFRVLILNVNKIDMGKVLRQFSRGGSEEQFLADFKQTLNQYQEIRRSVSNSGNVQLRLMDFVPPFRLYIFPKLEGDGVLYVEIYSYRAPFGSVPKFRISKQENPEWYGYFANQFEAMWKDAEVVNLTS